MRDIALSDYNGDIVIIDGDLKLTDNINESDKIIIYNRLSTQNPDWFHYIKMGANLEEMIGEQNTRANGEEIVRRISNSLGYYDAVTKTNFMDPSQYDIRAVPVDKNSILIVITINKTKVYVNFDYTTGLSEVI